MGTPVQELFDLKGQVALVTGGSRGLGLQMAEALGEAGAKVMLTARKAAELEEACATLSQKGIDARWIAADASQPADIQRVVDETMARLGRIDILVNNAGATWGAPAEDYPLEAWDKVMNLNIRSLFLFAQAVGKAWMVPNRSGRVINVASIAGLSGSIDVKFLAYGTSKGAVVNFTRTLAGEWGAYGITVNALAPGFFPSKMTKGVIAAFGTEKLAASAPLKRLGDDEDLKGAVLLFASRAGKHITGQILAVDGGVSAVHGAVEVSLEFKVNIPFVKLLGMTLEKFDPDMAEIHLELREDLTNSWGVAHGGVTMSLLDVVMAHAARSPTKPGGDAQPGVVTVEMKTTFLRPGQGKLFATGRRLHRTATLAFCDGEVRDEAGRLVGTSSGTFKFLGGLPVGDGRRIQKLNASD